MNEEKIEAIKNALREIMQILVQKGTPLSPEIKLKLAQVMEFAATRIKELREQETIPGSVPEAPEIPNGPYPSSNINGFRFDPKSKQLLVQFHGPYPQAAGSVYAYENVPSYIFDIFARGAIGPKTSGANSYHKWIKGVTPSLGGSLNALIKAGGFQYSKIS